MLAVPRWVAEELMKAPAACTKLYLYGQLRDTAEDAEQIAAETGLSTRDVLEGLETLKNLMLLSDEENTAAYTYRLNAPVFGEPAAAVYDNTEFNMQLQALFSDRILSIKDYAAFYECKEVYGLPETVILMLAEDSIINHKAKNRLPMNYIKKIGQEWSAEGINTVALAAAKMEANRSEKESAEEVLRLLGMIRHPSAEEEKLYQKWVRTWGFSFGGIRAAMAATTAAGTPSMKYLDKILEDLYSRGKVTQNDISQHLLDTEQTDNIMKKLMSRLGIRRPVTDDLRMLYSRWRTMGFTEREILFAGSVAHNSNGTIDLTDKLLTGWRMKNLIKLEDIEALLKNDEERKLAAEALLSRAGIKKSVTKTDIERYERMQRKYGFSAEIMLYAAECAYGYASPMKAIETILSGWHDANITTIEEAQEEHKNHKAKLAAGRNAKAPRFDERSYTREELDARIDDPLKELLEELEQ